MHHTSSFLYDVIILSSFTPYYWSVSLSFHYSVLPSTLLPPWNKEITQPFPGTLSCITSPQRGLFPEHRRVQERWSCQYRSFPEKQSCSRSPYLPRISTTQITLATQSCLWPPLVSTQVIPATLSWSKSLIVSRTMATLKSKGALPVNTGLPHNTTLLHVTTHVRNHLNTHVITGPPHNTVWSRATSRLRVRYKLGTWAIWLAFRSLCLIVDAGSSCPSYLAPLFTWDYKLKKSGGKWPLRESLSQEILRLYSVTGSATGHGCGSTF